MVLMMTASYINIRKMQDLPRKVVRGRITGCGVVVRHRNEIIKENFLRSPDGEDVIKDPGWIGCFSKRSLARFT